MPAKELKEGLPEVAAAAVDAVQAGAAEAAAPPAAKVRGTEPGCANGHNCYKNTTNPNKNDDSVS